MTKKTVVAGLAVAALLAGCASDDQMSSAPERAFDQGSADGFDGDEMADDVAPNEAPQAPDAAGGSAESDIVTFGGSATAGRELARTASVILEVDDVEQIAQRVTAAAERAGGFVSGANIRGGDFGYGVMTLRVPASRLDDTLTDIGGLGLRVVESSIATEDLTDQLTDLAARIRNLELLEAELQAVLTDVRDGDPNATQLLQVFERLSQVRGDIERLEAQRSGASQRVTLATINVELVPTSIAPEATEPRPDTTLGQAWASTKDAFAAIGAGLTWFGVTILPVSLVVIGIPALIIYLLARTLQRRRTARQQSRIAATPPPPVAPPTHAAVGAPTDAPTVDSAPNSDLT